MRRNKKKLEERIESARSVAERAVAYYNLGLFHDNNGREGEAIPNYKQALKHGLKKDVKAKAFAWLASSLHKTGRSREAMLALEQSRKIANSGLQKFLNGLEARMKHARVRES